MLATRDDRGRWSAALMQAEGQTGGAHRYRGEAAVVPEHPAVWFMALDE